MSVEYEERFKPAMQKMTAGTRRRDCRTLAGRFRGHAARGRIIADSIRAGRSSFERLDNRCSGRLSFPRKHGLQKLQRQRILLADVRNYFFKETQRCSRHR
jgi:hypothetical protein